ncbi:hypothetical protein [Bacillus massiliigorillae]|uniref:hypothetical protein n=1 Tax=Bacillus massiliigorillae TaxID=1243664 RepID=UPI0005AA248F|nr:hypothetical protein [Bacillus massiliigorillae]
MDKYKTVMILHYFNNVRASYSYNELLMLFGFQKEQLDLMLEELLKADMLKLDQYFKLTDKGLDELKRINLLEVDYDSVDEEEIFTQTPMSFTEVYIPKRFDKKFKSNII